MGCSPQASRFTVALLANGGPEIIRPYTVAEVAQLTGFSRQTVIRMFEHEPGVLIVEPAEKLRNRGYRSLRIPRRAYERVIEKIRVD
jgi:hypothetical protein